MHLCDTTLHNISKFQIIQCGFYHSCDTQTVSESDNHPLYITQSISGLHLENHRQYLHSQTETFTH
jgi:hypothetical protein